MGTREADLDAKARVLAEDRVAFADLEKRSRKALKTLYEHGLEKPLDTDEDGPTQLLPLVVKALEEVVDGLGPMAEAEARVLSSAALTCFLSHLYLRDPNARLDELLEPVAEDLCEAATAVVQCQVRLCWGSSTALSPILCLAMLRILRLVVKVRASSPMGGGAPSAQAVTTSRGDPRLFSLFYSNDIHQALWRRLDFPFGIVRMVCL